MKWNDPIVEEVRATRERLLREAGGFEAYIKKLRTLELDHPQRLLSKDDLKSKESSPIRHN
ncbi:hypothetical protein D2Q93_12725 [Alicyclobacillaceae bacterium I2511]|nr:hypothetical protein D2Q93_12725 [Alicyclobacillaceae bacterium I2511]